jgi:calcineurin-like phosphoesterase family protein
MAAYCCSDLHGQKILLEKIIDFIQPDDKVYFLGDAADRGPDGWEMIKMILNDERFVYLLGNHEDMLAAAAKEYFMFDHFGSDCHLLMQNGGESTFNSMLADPMGEKLVARISHLPTYKIYWNALGQCIFLSHAGFTPWLDEDEKLIIPEDRDLIWNRNHYLDDWDENMIAPDTIIVHGHTPIPFIMDDLRLPDPGDLIEAGPLWYCKNRKVCLDCAAFATGAAFLLDLDTFESITIRDTD